MAICNKNHRYNPQFDELSPAQGGDGRHKCAGCAYDQGRDDGKEGRNANCNPDSLPESQAGTIRHKNVNEAYALGYQHGVAERGNTKKA
ncbi:hypothetical protein [Oleidesulfovibrio alaskensis]|uniref:hypothetical protein n=1 Tax=Oleidesulfovibrio alaskensis TaxID=58180 RepID=UPI0009E05D3C|nr:hypothetical protein [Oleidesulfovibrio alaskensis]